MGIEEKKINKSRKCRRQKTVEKEKKLINECEGKESCEKAL